MRVKILSTNLNSQRLNNLLITGPPRCGKTTVVKKIINDPQATQKLGGFYTEEFRKKGERVGFKIISLPNKKEGILARKGLSSLYRVGKYGVNLEDFEKIGCSAVKEALSAGKTIIIDEIGKMELYSDIFKDVLLHALDSTNRVLATIMEKKNEFADEIKKRKDVKLISLDRTNFITIFMEVKSWFEMFS